MAEGNPSLSAILRFRSGSYERQAIEERMEAKKGSTGKIEDAYVMCRAEKSNLVTGPHQRWGTGYLFDNIVIEGNRQSGLEAINRGAGGSGHGWAGATTVFWNCTANSAHVMDPPTPERNFVIGFTGGPTSGDGHVESPDRHVEPQRLFLQQLKDRLRKGIDCPPQKHQCS